MQFAVLLASFAIGALAAPRSGGGIVVLEFLDDHDVLLASTSIAADGVTVPVNRK